MEANSACEGEEAGNHAVRSFFFFAVHTQTSTSRLDRFVQPEQTQHFEFGCHAVFVVTF